MTMADKVVADGVVSVAVPAEEGKEDITRRDELEAELMELNKVRVHSAAYGSIHSINIR